jgi:hypothetical protein
MTLLDFVFTMRIYAWIDHREKSEELLHKSKDSGTNWEGPSNLRTRKPSLKDSFLPVLQKGVPPFLFESEMFGSKKHLKAVHIIL